jgi:hypothetical protein
MIKKTVKETAQAKGLAFLIESELDKAEVVIAAKGILSKLQGMAEDLAKIEADDIMPILDNMRLTFGPELTDSFNDITTAKIRQTMEAVKGAKEAITREVGRLENTVNGEPTNDLGMGDEGMGMDGDMADGSFDAPEDNDLDVPPMPDAADPDAVPTADLAAGGEEGPDAGGLADELDAAFDKEATAGGAAGRARKESAMVSRNVKALRESKNPDMLIYAAFKRTMKESRKIVESARAVAKAFAIDFDDVATIVKEHAVKESKTRKDEKGRKDKNDDRSEDRKTKKRERPTDIDEGKTFKDEEGKTSKNKDRSEDRATKKRERPKDIDEGKTFKDEDGKTDKNKDRSEDRKTKKRERPSDLDEAKKSFKAGGIAGKPSDAPVEESVLNRFQPRKGLSDFRTRRIDVVSQEDGTARAVKDYNDHVNRTMEVPYIYAMVDGEARQFNSHSGDPFIIRVSKTMPELVKRWNGENLSPRWQVKVENGQGVVPPDVKSGFIDAPGYRFLPQRPR